MIQCLVRSCLRISLACLMWIHLTERLLAQRVGLLDHCTPSYLQFSDPEFSATSDSRMATITVVRTGEYRVPVSVQYSTADGTALADDDYTSVSGTLSIPAGMGTATFSVPILGAARVSSTVQLILSSPSFNAVITRAVAILNIIEDIATAADVSPVLSVRPDGQGQVVVSWRPGTWICTLEKSENPTGNAWNEVSGIVRTLDGCSTATESAAGGCSIYRLRIQ
jgi:hypothetical protein